MAYYCIDIPSKLQESDYHRILRGVVDKISALENVEAIYQIGGIASPGISDLDLVVVFRNDAVCRYNLHEHLSNEEKYLFIHKLYGCSVRHFQESSRFSFFHNFSLLFGTDVKREEKLAESETVVIKNQIALEYMVKMYVNLILQKEYSTLQLRSLLLHGKALNYDLEFLGVDALHLKGLVATLLEVRNNWFKTESGRDKLKTWFREFIEVYPKLLDSILKVRGMYMPKEASYKIAGNIYLLKADSLDCLRKGFLLPAFPTELLGKKYFRLQNKFNSFEIRVPFRTVEIPDALLKYFNFQNKQREYNQKNLPHFYPLASSLLT